MPWDCACGRTGIPNSVTLHWPPNVRHGERVIPCDGNVISLSDLRTDRTFSSEPREEEK